MITSAEAVEAMVEVVPCEEVPESLEKKRIDYLAERKRPLRARYAYGIIFLITSLWAWFVRDYAQRVLPELHYMKSCGSGGNDCFHTLGVLRILFNYMVNLLVLVQASHDRIFLFLQLISVIHFINWWNKYWMPDEQKKQSCSLGLFMSTLFYIASMSGIAFLYSSHAMKSSCVLNIIFITWTTILLIVMMVISLHSKVNRGLLSSGIMASYIVFLCWSAIRSEPANEECNRQKQGNVNGDWSTILGFLIAICSIVTATFSTGIDSQSFQFQKDEVQEDDDIPYKYGFFHLTFSLGAMYFAMLFISWNLNNSAKKWSIDVGWTSTWVKIVNEWFAASIFLWTLIYPVLRQSKVMDHEEPVQELDNSAVP
ncbi:unnamed protein product [Prunus armeniaca]